ncbi:MAG: LCP family protein [Oscillospiraceae bacterium]|nr:LCP family protein [Oscillospiraceae bacterium]
MKKKTTLSLLLLVILLVCAMGFGFYYVQQKAKQEDLSKASQEDLARRYRPSIIYQLQSYPLKRNMSSVLLIGTDNFVDDDKQIADDKYFNNSNFADFLVVLVFDHGEKTVTPFQINRDTMCNVPRVNIAGQPLVSRYAQITYAYTYGSGKEDSCVNTRNCVESLLFQVPIDNYLAFTMDAVPLVNDLVGGVTVTLENDIPSLGPEFVKDATVMLKGKDALRFVRYRDTTRMDGNLTRMSNQQLYINGFTTAAREAAGEDPDLAVKAFKLVSPFLHTDLSVDQVEKIVNDLLSYELLPFVTPKGEYDLKEGERFVGFYVDEASLWSCVNSTFCA